VTSSPARTAMATPAATRASGGAREGRPPDTSPFAGTGTLLRFHLRRDRVMIVSWVAVIALFVWLVIATSQLILRRRMGAAAKELELKMWFFPYLTWIAIGSIVALIIGMVILESTRESLFLSLGLAAVVVGIGVFRYRRNGGSPHQDAASVEPSAVGSGPAS